MGRSTSNLVRGAIYLIIQPWTVLINLGSSTCNLRAYPKVKKHESRVNRNVKKAILRSMNCQKALSFLERKVTTFCQEDKPVISRHHSSGPCDVDFAPSGRNANCLPLGNQLTLPVFVSLENMPRKKRGNVRSVVSSVRMTIEQVQALCSTSTGLDQLCLGRIMKN